MTYHYNCYMTKWVVNDLQIQLSFDKTGENDLQMKLLHDKTGGK